MSAVAFSWTDGLNRNKTGENTGTLSFYARPLYDSDYVNFPENSYEYVITESMVENLLACTKYGLFIGQYNANNLSTQISVGINIKNDDGTVTYAEAIVTYSALLEGGADFEFEPVE